MEVIRETLWKRCLSTPTKPPAKNSNICLSETAYQHKGTRKKCKKTNQAAIIQWQRQCLMDKPHRTPWSKSKTIDISKPESQSRVNLLTYWDKNMTTTSHLFVRTRSFHRPTFIRPAWSILLKSNLVGITLLVARKCGLLTNRRAIIYG